jgi:FkbM family methyltransferase
LARALADLGENEELRDRLVQLLREAEGASRLPLGRSYREEVSGPIVDALFKKAGVLHKALSGGLRFDFLYRSKIARDLVLTRTDVPDHVFEPQTTKLLLSLARGKKQVVVGGAYGGDHVLLAAGAVAPTAGTVHAFEPNSEQIALLQVNAKQNGIDNVRANQIGLWRTDTLLEVVGQDAYAHAIEARPNLPAGADTFRATSLDAYGKREALEFLDVIMLDVEGAELPIFEGAARYLSQPVGRAPNLIYEVHRHYVDWSDGLAATAIVRFLSSFGYTSFAVRDFQSNVDMKGCKVELVPLESAYLDGPPHGFNMVAVKDVSLLEVPEIRFVENVSPKLLIHKDPALHHPTEWRTSG